MVADVQIVDGSGDMVKHSTHRLANRKWRASKVTFWGFFYFCSKKYCFDL